jgi:hypothetical protein
MGASAPAMCRRSIATPTRAETTLFVTDIR